MARTRARKSARSKAGSAGAPRAATRASPAAVGLERVASRGAPAEPAFERADFLARVRAIFATLDRPYLERVDASGPPDAVESRIAAAISRRLGLL